jgi:hypothetical protein
MRWALLIIAGPRVRQLRCHCEFRAGAWPALVDESKAPAVINSDRRGRCDYFHGGSAPVDRASLAIAATPASPFGRRERRTPSFLSCSDRRERARLKADTTLSAVKDASRRASAVAFGHP